MIAWRVAAADLDAPLRERGGMLWFPRELQGEGRHDNPELYGCLYVAASPESAIAESLAAFRGSGELQPAMLRRGGKRLYLGKLALADQTAILDLDDPRILLRAELRPSQVATRQRSTTQAYAARLYRSHPELGALSWWSTVESTLVNLTIFDRAHVHLTLEDAWPLAIDAREVRAAAELLGLA